MNGKSNPITSLFRPLKALSFLGRPPVTLPMEPRPAAANYRGFHVNDWTKCIGCGTCQQICDNKAISMVHIPSLPADPLKGVKPYRPAIDYGRCCWCALCVDICPTGSIALSREYVHINPDLNTYFILPDEKGMHGLGFPKGWAKSDDADLLDHKRQAMGEIEPEVRLKSFAEIVHGYDAHTAMLEASRCIQCGMCHDACPTHMHAPEYIRALWMGDVEAAVREIYRTNPLASVCGRVCTHRCEEACSMNHRGDPIAIRWLKRYALDSLPHDRVKGIAAEGRAAHATGRRVAIVGAGPAGLTTAYDLARDGHAVTLFEALPKPGGMMRYGIPEYRLPYARLDDDIDVIASLGVEIRCSIRIGRDIGMDELQRDYDAVLVSIGLQEGRSTRIPGSEHEQVMSAVELLRRVTLEDDFRIPRSAVVIGGGNVAMDAARTLARLQQRTHGKVNVLVTCLESEEEMLADPDEISEALEEGVELEPCRGPKCCVIGDDGALACVEAVTCLSVFDESGRFHPQYDEDQIYRYDCELVVEAIGQVPGLGFLGEELTERLEWDGRRLKIDAAGQTSEDWLWAAGDVVEGPDVIHAVAAGHRAAVGIHAYLTAGATVEPAV
jgi:glutamate synthase (NADPH/NADH) small chain